MGSKRRLFFLVGFIALAVAQPSEAPAAPVIKFFPLSLADPFQMALHVGAEFPIASPSSLQAEAAWVFGQLEEESEKIQNLLGWKVRGQWRLYFAPPATPRQTRTGGYISLQPGYQYYRYNLYRNEPDSTLTQFIRLTYTRRIQALSMSFLLGYQAQLGDKLALDVFGGLGVRTSSHRWHPTDPGYGGIFGDNPIGDVILRPGLRPIFRLGVSVGILL